MTVGGSRESDAGDVLRALGEAASQVGGFATHVVEEQPGTALAAAAAAGFLAGGGLSSRLGARLTSTTMRVTLGNLTTLIALDFLRRALENGGAVGDPGHPGPE